jgi:hypothetical protein
MVFLPLVQMYLCRTQGVLFRIRISIKSQTNINNTVLADNGTDADLWRDGMAIIRNGLYNNYVIILHSLYERSLSMKFLHKIGLIMFCIVLIPLDTNIIIF